MGINKKMIILLNKTLLKEIKPDFTFLNIVSIQNLKLRLKKRKNKNRYDYFDNHFYNKVQKGYMKLAKNNKKYLIVDSNKKITENKNLILKRIKKLI